MVGPVICEDGWHSPSIGRQGACSHHGGVNNDPQNAVGFLSFLSGIAGCFYSYKRMSKFAEKRIREEKELAKKIYEEKHKNDPHCPKHPGERMIKVEERRGSFWRCPRYPRCKKTKKIADTVY